MTVVLKACPVPWSSSPSQSNVTLEHCETSSGVECCVSLLANRFDGEVPYKDCKVRIDFESTYLARTGVHQDWERITDLPGYSAISEYRGNMDDYLDWRLKLWKETGFCPDGGFYVATASSWLVREGYSDSGWHHFVVDGRDGYVEVIAKNYSWRQWSWVFGERDDLAEGLPPIAIGDGP